MKRDNLMRADECVEYKAPWYVRLAAQIISRHMGKQGIKSYQCVGEKNWDYADNMVDVQVPTEYIISSILCSVGDGVSPHGVKIKYSMQNHAKV